MFKPSFDHWQVNRGHLCAVLLGFVWASFCVVYLQVANRNNDTYIHSVPKEDMPMFWNGQETYWNIKEMGISAENAWLHTFFAGDGMVWNYYFLGVTEHRPWTRQFPDSTYPYWWLNASWLSKTCLSMSSHAIQITNYCACQPRIITICTCTILFFLPRLFIGS